MDKPSTRLPQPNEPDAAAAEWLFQESPPAGSHRPEEAPTRSGPIEEFELADTPVVAASPRPTSSADPVRAAGVTRSRMVAPSAPAVEQVWSRAAEWGPTFLILFGWGGAVLVLSYFLFGAEQYGVAVLVFGLGCLVAVLLSYPLLITLERPVRITPEQAARDYFAALSHHFPHYRRMWLLLSAAGRVSPQFASYEGFKSYWTMRVAQLREGHAGQFSPLVFKVDEFQAEKSAGKTEMNAKFKVRVLVRGRQAAGPIWSLPVERSFVRGPDSMWYLNDGTLGERPRVSSDEPRSPREDRLA